METLCPDTLNIILEFLCLGDDTWNVDSQLGTIMQVNKYFRSAAMRAHAKRKKWRFPSNFSFDRDEKPNVCVPIYPRVNHVEIHCDVQNCIDVLDHMPKLVSLSGELVLWKPNEISFLRHLPHLERVNVSISIHCPTAILNHCPARFLPKFARCLNLKELTLDFQPVAGFERNYGFGDPWQNIYRYWLRQLQQHCPNLVIHHNLDRYPVQR